MLIGTSEWRSGRSEVDTRIVLDRRCRAHVVRRRGLLFDSRYSVGASEHSAKATLYFVLSGSFEPAGRPRQRTPAIWALAEDEFERVTPAARTFRSWGDAIVADLCLDATDVKVPIGLDHGPIELDGETRDAIERLVTSADRIEQQRSYRRLLETLVRRDLVSPEVALESEPDEAPHLERLWEALSGLYGRQDTGITVDLLSVLAKLSPRQIYRDTSELLTRFKLPSSFRRTVRLLRLRRAALLLSAPDLQVSDVARIVGYGSADAMARAFRDEGLPSPSAVRSEVLYPGEIA
jgi:AraC-like DNA-binding protein